MSAEFQIPGGPLGPALLFDSLTEAVPAGLAAGAAAEFALLAAPGQRVPEDVRPGDLLVERALAEGGLATVLPVESTPLAEGAWLRPNQAILRPLGGPATVFEGLPEDDGGGEAEAAPAFIAVAGAVISAAQLGIAVFDRLERHALSGSFKVTSQAASYIHDPSPSGLRIQTRTFRFELSAHHPRYGIGSQTFAFVVTLEYDGFNIRRLSVVEDIRRSSTLVGSDFHISFTPSRYSSTSEPVTKIAYNIQGKWDPIGSGEESFDGRLLVDSQGGMSGRINSPRRWVGFKAGIRASGGGPVPQRRRVRYTSYVLFEREGQTRLSEAMRRHLHGWLTARLPEAVRNEIRAGNVEVQVSARTSTTGSVDTNRRIAHSRARSVEGAVRDAAGSRVQVNVRAPGELEAATPDRTPAASERRVDLAVPITIYR